MQLSSVQNLIEDVRYFDLMLAGDKTILEAADVTERKRFGFSIIAKGYPLFNLSH